MSKPKKIETNNIVEYLGLLKEEQLDELFFDPWVCLGVFRSLDPYTQQYILAQLFSDGGASYPVLPFQVSHETEKLLLRLHLITKSRGTYRVNSSFQQGLQSALTLPKPQTASQVKVNPDKLERHAQKKWNAILHYIAALTSSVNDGIRSLLKSAGLVHLGRNNVEITSKGFQFLLEDSRTQVWRLLKKYLDTAPARNMQINEMVAFLFRLSFQDFGCAYPFDNLTQTQKTVLVDLHNFGLIQYRENYYCPTRLAIGIASPTSSAFSALATATIKSRQEGYIIVETNYRLYAYTSSVLQIALLALFVDMQYNTPNMVVGTITRDSVRKALINGITANQILRFLYQHAHPQLQKRNPVIPATIADQIKLWEGQRNRLQATPVYLYEHFPHFHGFQMVLDHARETEVLVWYQESEDLGKCYIAVNDYAHKEMSDFIKRKVK